MEVEANARTYGRLSGALTYADREKKRKADKGEEKRNRPSDGRQVQSYFSLFVILSMGRDS